MLDDISSKLKASKNELPVKIDKLLIQQKDLERELSKLKSQLASGGSQDMVKNVKDVKGVKLLAAKMVDTDVASLRELSDNLKVKMGSGIIILASIEKDKVSFVVSVTKDLVEKKYSAGNIAKNFAKLISGSGGGRPDFAQGGGKDASKIDEALEKIADNLI